MITATVIHSLFTPRCKWHLGSSGMFRSADWELPTFLGLLDPWR